MNDQPPHRLFHHYSELPYSLRVLYTAALLILGMGYLFALLNIYFTYRGRAGGNPLMLSEQDVAVAYSGSNKGSILEHALSGPMATMLPPDQRATLLRWARQGAPKSAYPTTIKPILDHQCMTCHDGSNPHLPNLSTYAGLKKVTALDTGASIATLVLNSHIHLFGMTFIFFLVGLMFSHAYVRPVWLKCTLVALPYAAIALDVSSWYFIKIYPPFTWALIFAGMVMAACFATMWLIMMFQMWFMRPPAAILERMGGDLPVNPWQIAGRAAHSAGE